MDSCRAEKTGNFVRISDLWRPYSSVYGPSSAKHEDVHVSLVQLHSIPEDVSLNGEEDSSETDFFSTVYTKEPGLLIKLRVFDGQICMLSSTDLSHRREHPVILKLILQEDWNPNPYSRTESALDVAKDGCIYVPPCIAASIGFYSFASTTHESYSLYPIRCKNGFRMVRSLLDIPIIKRAHLREIAFPPCDHMPDFQSLVTSPDQRMAHWKRRFERKRSISIEKLKDYFLTPGGKQVSRLVNKYSLIGIVDDYSTKEDSLVRYYALENIETESDMERFRVEPDQLCFLLSRDSQIALLPRDGNSNTSISEQWRRLPPSTLVKSFTKSAQGATPEPMPNSFFHPSVDEIIDAILKMNSGFVCHSCQSQSHIMVVGHDDNHIVPCIDAVADLVGMRVVHVLGLAAFAYRYYSLFSQEASSQISTGSIKDKLIGLQASFDIARRSSPCILHVSLNDELLTGNSDSRIDDENRLLSCIKEELAKIRTTSSPRSNKADVNQVVVILSNSSHVDGPLSSSILDKALRISYPDEKYARVLWSNDRTFDYLFRDYLLGRTANEITFVKEQLKSIITHASIKDTIKSVSGLLKKNDLRQNLFHDGISTNGLSRKLPDVKWNDVGGMQHVRKEVMDAIEIPIKYPELFLNGKRRGILFWGPPGGGKTLVAKAIASESGLPFISIKGPQLLGSYVGESEANIRSVFTIAREAACSNRNRKNGGIAILFFDEIDSVAPRRGKSEGGGVMDRVTVTLLAELDAQQDDEHGRVFVIGATNRPDLLDPAIFRPGRIDRILYLGLPENREDRMKILASQCRKFTFENNMSSQDVASEVVDYINPSLTGADISSIATAAVTKSLKRVCDRADLELVLAQSASPACTLEIDDVLSKWNEEAFVPKITRDDLISASFEVKPSVCDDELKRYSAIKSSWASSMLD